MNKEDSVLEVLMYLFDNYFDDDHELPSDHDHIRTELVRAGFNDAQVSRAFDWLEGLVSQDLPFKADGSEHVALRIFSEMEMEKLDAGCRGYLLYLEQAGILDANKRELVIDRVLALDPEDLDLPQLKWIILMVLLNQPDMDLDSSWMEGLVMDDERMGFH